MDLNCYKVVRRRNGKLYSTGSNLYSNCGDWVVEYLPGKIVKPKVKDTSLYVFKTYKAAKEFTSAEDDNCEVWSCTVTNPKKIVLVNPYEFLIKRFWELKRARKSVAHLKRDLSGTISLSAGLCVSSVMLIERIS